MRAPEPSAPAGSGLWAIGGKVSYDVATGIVVTVVIAGASYLLRYLKIDLVQNVLIGVLLLGCGVLFWLWRRRPAAPLPQPAESGAYDVCIDQFSTLSDQVGEVLERELDAPGDAPATYLLHWVPTFSLSRGLDRATQEVRPQHSATYKLLRENLVKTRGKIVCFDGAGIYRFLDTSGLLFEDPKLTASYLDEVVDVLSDGQINIAFLPWGLFPYTLVSVGLMYAVFDFTTISDIKESDGYVRASGRLTLRLETSREDEVVRVRGNMFSTIYDGANKDPDLRVASTEYLRKIADVLRSTGRLLSPDQAERKLWSYPEYRLG